MICFTFRSDTQERLNTYWLNFLCYMSCSGSLVPNQYRGSAALINVGCSSEQVQGWALDQGNVSLAKNRQAYRLAVAMPYLALHRRGGQYWSLQDSSVQCGSNLKSDWESKISYLIKDFIDVNNCVLFHVKMRETEFKRHQIRQCKLLNRFTQVLYLSKF